MLVIIVSFHCNFSFARPTQYKDIFRGYNLSDSMKFEGHNPSTYGYNKIFFIIFLIIKSSIT